MYGSNRATFFLSVASTRVGFLRLRFLFRDFLLIMWLAKALFLMSLPLPVLLNRFKAPLFVFIFGMIRYLFRHNEHGHIPSLHLGKGLHNSYVFNFGDNVLQHL